LIAGRGRDVAQGRDGSALTEDDTGWGNPHDPEVGQDGEQPHDGLAGQPRTGEVELDADSLPIQNRPEASLVYLIAASCLAGSLVSVWVAVIEMDLAAHNRVGNLAIVGMVIGALAGLAAVAVNEEKPRGWAGRINIAAAWLALISFSTLLLLFLGQHGWYGDGG
jgi:hypothetical protein